MTHRIGNIVVIAPTGNAKCDMCGKQDELRPYGPRGENVCFDCGMKDKAAVERHMDALFGKRQ